MLKEQIEKVLKLTNEPLPVGIKPVVEGYRPALPDDNLALKHEDKLNGQLAEYLERKLIVDTLAYFNGNKLKTAEALGVAEGTIHNKVKKYNI